jgi:predicted Zn-dependent protease
MNRRTSNRIAGAALALFVLFASVGATPRTPKEERNLAGTLINQDYFTADLYQEVSQLKWLVEKGHWGERVIRNFRTGDIAWAEGDCVYTLEKFPNHPGALHMISEIGKKTNRPGLGVPYFETALMHYPQYAYTHAQYGRFLVEQGAVNAGILELKEALALDPSFVIAKAWLEEAERTASATGSPRSLGP